MDIEIVFEVVPEADLLLKSSLDSLFSIYDGITR